MSDLKKLVRLEEERKNGLFEQNGKKAAGQFSKNTPVEPSSPRPTELKKSTSAKQIEVTKNHSSEDSGTSSSEDELDFDMADDIIPLDETAESTLHHVRQNESNRKQDKSKDDQEPEWLKKVATLVNATGKKKFSKTSSYGSEFEVKDAHASQNNSRNDEQTANVLAKSRAIPLLKVQKDQRHKCKVINIKDKNRVVGQVNITCIKFSLNHVGLTN